MFIIGKIYFFCIVIRKKKPEICLRLSVDSVCRQSFVIVNIMSLVCVMIFDVIFVIKHRKITVEEYSWIFIRQTFPTKFISKVIQQEKVLILIHWSFLQLNSHLISPLIKIFNTIWCFVPINVCSLHSCIRLFKMHSLNEI